tara:strand:+ start:68 stop:250 length:183 start_codon:yes stop_codon:yes gene_type:complete
MNMMGFERIFRDIKRGKGETTVSKSPKVSPLKEKTKETIKTIKKNTSTDNFMKYQWTWTL